MTSLLPEEVSERTLSTCPLPIADAFGALLGAESAFEQRDRVVEVFRATLRTLSGFTLAARLQYGSGPGAESAQIPELIRSLRSRGLTDGQWFAMVREVLRPWAQAPGSHPLPALVTAVHGKKAELPKLVDELLVMRKSETVAHGASGTKAAIQEILEKRVPQLLKLLSLLDPVFAEGRLVVPLATPADEEEAQSAWLLTGYTPPRGRWRRCSLAAGARVSPGEAALLDRENKPIVALHPIVLVRRPSPEAVEEFFTLDGGSKKGAVFVALPSMAEHRETDAWGALAKALEGDDSRESADVAPGAERPYRGLASFGPEHAALFFGREEQAESLANRIRRHSLVTVTGPSGSGKTSLLRAGALSQLSDATVVFLRPGASPLESLAHRLSDCLGSGFEEGQIATWIREEPSQLLEAIAAWSRQPISPPPTDKQSGSPYRGGVEARRIVIVVDQAEELFTLCADEAKREAFGRALASLGGTLDSACRVVLSVREDFFGRFATISALRGLYNQVVEVVTTPDREALARTLYLPAKHFGVAFEDEALVWAMVDAVEREPAALALLQFCADRLWEVRDRTWKRLSWEAYRALGGVEGALAAHADRTLAEMSGSAERTARELLLRLVTAERTRATASRTELVDSASSHEDAKAVLDRLISARLCTVRESDDGGEAHVEIVHEALIKHWGKLSGWLAEDVEGQRLLHAVRQASKEWDSRGRAKGLLWSGEALSDLQRWRRRATGNLAGTEAAFFEASQAEETRGKRLRRGLVLGAFVATGAFGAFMFWQWRAAESARMETEKAQNRAEVRGLVSEAHNQEPAGRSGKALSLFRAAAALENPDKPGASTEVSLEMERLYRSGAAAIVLDGHEAQVRSMDVCHGHPWLATGSFDGRVRVWDTESGALLRTLGKAGEKVRAVVCSPDGRTIAAAVTAISGSSGSVRLWDSATGAEKRSLDFKTGVARVLYSPNQEVLAAVLDEGPVHAYRGDGSEALSPFGGAEEGAEEAVFSDDGKWLATLQGASVRVYTVANRKLQSAIQGTSGQVTALAFAKDGSLAAPMSTLVRLFDPATGKERRAISTPDPGSHDNGKIRAVRSLAFSPDGALAAGGGMDDLVRVWDLSTGQIKHQLRVHTGEITAVSFSADSTRLVSASMDGTGAVWDMASGALVQRLTGHEAEVLAARFVGPSQVVTSSYDRTARIWDVRDASYSRTVTKVVGGFTVTSPARSQGRIAAASEKEARVLDIRTGDLINLIKLDAQISSVALSPGATHVAVGTSGVVVEGTLQLFEASANKPLATIPGHEKGVTALCFSKDGLALASGAGDGAAQIWDVQLNRPQATLPVHATAVTALSFSGDGKLLVSASRDGKIRVSDARTGGRIRELTGGQGPVLRMAVSPDGRTVLVAQDAEVRLWDITTGEPKGLLTGYEQAILGMAFSPDGKTFAGTASDGVTRLWSFPECKLIRELRTPNNGGYDVAFSPDGQRLFVAGGEGQSYVWDATTGILLQRLHAATFEPGLPIADVMPDSDRETVTIAEDGSLLRFLTPPADRKTTFTESGKKTSYRVCRQDFRVISVLPIPEADAVWAPEAQCAPKSNSR